MEQLKSQLTNSIKHRSNKIDETMLDLQSKNQSLEEVIIDEPNFKALPESIFAAGPNITQHYIKVQPSRP